MNNGWHAEGVMALRLALQHCKSADCERWLRRAILFLDRPPQPRAEWKCIKDGAPCVPECTSNALQGRCGREQ